MKFLRVFPRILISFLLAVSLTIPAMGQENDSSSLSVENGCHSLDAKKPYLGTAKITNTKAALLYEWKTDTLLYAYNADEKLYPSSFTKILTAIMAVERGDLAEIITVKEEVVDALPSNAMSVNLKAGEELSLENLIHCMMVGSGNDAAAVIADHIGGSVSAFVEQMNGFAADLGCTATNFTNPHGLHDANQYTTARDMGRILSYAAKNETFMKFFGTVSYKLEETNMYKARSFTTNNHLMTKSVMDIYYNSRVTGGRTGVTNDGRRSIAVTAKKGSMNLISIIMGSKDTYTSSGAIRAFGGFSETTELLNKGFSGLRAAQIFHAGQILKQYNIPGAENDLFLGIQETCNAVLPTGVDVDDLRFVYNETGYPVLPISGGSIYGSVDVWYGSHCVASAKLYAMNDVVNVQSYAVMDRYTEKESNDISFIWFLVAAVALFVGFLLMLRFSPKFRKLVFRRRRRRRNY